MFKILERCFYVFHGIQSRSICFFNDGKVDGSISVYHGIPIGHIGSVLYVSNIANIDSSVVYFFDGSIQKFLRPFDRELMGAIRFLSPIRMFPAGDGKLLLAMAMVTSSGLKLFARSKSGSALTTMDRALPPKGAGAETPGTFTSIGRIFVKTSVWISLMDR